MVILIGYLFIYLHFFFMIGLNTAESADSGYTVSIGKSSDKSREFSRTVSVTLDDEDAGKETHLDMICLSLMLIFHFILYSSFRGLFHRSDDSRHCIWHTYLHDYGRKVQMSGKEIKSQL